MASKQNTLYKVEHEEFNWWPNKEEISAQYGYRGTQLSSRKTKSGSHIITEVGNKKDILEVAKENGYPVTKLHPVKDAKVYKSFASFVKKMG